MYRLFSLINTYQNFFFSCRLLLNVFCRSRIISYLLYFTISSLKPCLLWLTHQFLSSVCLTFFPLISCLCRSLSISCLSYPSTHFLSLTCHLLSLSLTYNFFSFVTHLWFLVFVAHLSFLVIRISHLDSCLLFLSHWYLVFCH